MASTLLMEISPDEHQRAKYRSRRMYGTDKFHNEATAEERGEIRGKQLGRDSMALEIARMMKFENEPYDKIVKFTGLTLAEVERA